MDTQANENLTPKPLEEHVPGGWNFVESPPGHQRFGDLRDTIIQIPEPTEMRIKLSAGARIHLVKVLSEVLDGNNVDTMLGGGYVDNADDPEWLAIEDALTEIMLPRRRWVLGTER